jgi:hypothetical protein
MNRYPAKPMMDEMAKYGRYGDTMLVHMNPAEVAGIASLVPGGRLTTNPVTGQPEAFLPLLLGFAAKGLGLSALGTGALVGAGTAAVTGDLKRGILSGLTAGFGAGIADAAGAAEVGATTAADVVQGGELADAISAADASVLEKGLEFGSEVTAADPSVLAGATPSVELAQMTGLDASPLDQLRGSVPDAFKSGTGIGEGISQNLGLTGNIAGAGIAAGTMEEDRLQEQFARQEMARLGEAEADRKEAYDDLQRGYAMAQPGIPTGLSDARSEMSRRTPPPMYMAEGGATKEDGNPYAGLGAARDIARFMGGARGYFGVDPVTVQQRLRGQDVIAPPRDYMPGFEPEFNYFQNLTRDPDGNIVGTPDVPDRSYRPMRQGVISRSQYFDPVLQAPQSNAQMNEYRRTLEKLDPGPLDEASVMGLASEGSALSTAQQNMFEQYAPLAPFNMAQRDRIFQLMDRGISMDQAIKNQQFSRSKGYDLNGDGVVTDAEFTQAKATAEAPDVPDVPDYAKGMSPEQQAAIQEYMQNFDPDTAKFLASLMTGGLGSIGNFMAEGGEAEAKKMPEVGPAPTAGDIPIRTSMMEGTVPDGGIARVPTEFTQQAMPSGQEMSMLAMAVLGQTENPDPIINMFVDKYGPDVYRQARKMILESVVPNAQTEGMVRGNGSGMDDMVQGMIGKDQPVAVSPGEYIVAADVVSGLGEGSSDAGAKELDKMMDKVRMERNGTTKQAPRINERKVMPA